MTDAARLRSEMESESVDLIAMMMEVYRMLVVLKMRLVQHTTSLVM